jgi:hypothetical protein
MLTKIHNQFKPRISNISVTLFLLGALSACGGGGGSESGSSTSTAPSTTSSNTSSTASVQAAPETNTLVISVIDSKSKAPVAATPIFLSFGADAATVLAAPPQATSTVAQTTRFDLKGDLTPSNSNPVRLSFTVSGTGFLSTAKDITIRGSGVTTVQVEVVSTETNAQGQLISNPAGATGTKTSLVTNSGVLSPGPSAMTANIDLQPFAGLAGPSTPNARVSLVVPVGVKLGTQSANSFASTANTAIDLFINSYSPYATESLSLFPSSMVGARYRDSSGLIQVIPRIRVDAAVNITAVGALGDHNGDFSDPVEVQIDMPVRSKDNANGLFTTLGETADVYWFEAATGLWIPTTTATLVDLARGKDTVAMQFSIKKTGTYAIFKRPVACGLNLTLARATGDTRALNVTVLTRGFLDGNIGITGTNYFNTELPEDAGAIYVTLPSGVKVAEYVLAAKSSTETCPRQATITVPQ